MSMDLNTTWEKTLEMWKWIAEQYTPGRNVGRMKRAWMSEHCLEYSNIGSNCLFCIYSVHRGEGCGHCPGRLVSKRFNCINRSYHYWGKPRKFYEKLCELNAKRLEGRK